QRNDALFRYSCSLRGRGLDRAEAEALLGVAALNCKPPLPADEALQCLDSAWRYEAPQEAPPEIAELARLPALEYERVRKEHAELLGMRVSVLDEQVERGRAAAGQPEEAIPCPLPIVEPARDPQDGAVLLDELAALFRRYVVLPPHAAETLALWVLFSWCIDSVRVAPVLAITSPEKRCGKTTVLSLLAGLCRRPLPSANLTAAVLYRAVEAWQPTLLIDEADTFLRNSDELRGILNSGHTRPTAFVLRTVGDDHLPARFSTWGAKAIALIGKLPDTLHDRALEVRLKRRLPGEPAEKLRLRKLNGAADSLAARCARWALDNAYALQDAEPAAPEALNDRAADNWEPLLAIADRAGGGWPAVARQAALQAAGGAGDEDSYRVLLLEDIRVAFDQSSQERLSTLELITQLGRLEERPWSDLERGQPISPRRLAKMLAGFAIRPVTVRLPSGATQKGYKRESFADTWARYLAPPAA
ncbi:MAG: DUF3631 domain-containing protein, partial [Chromatiales bacterium]|nr:DUF3631 domain-containing protein [Chromatiales bacterium]